MRKATAQLRAPRAVIIHGKTWAMDSTHAEDYLRQMTPDVVAKSMANFKPSGRSNKDYAVDDNGVATIELTGPLTKEETCMSWLFGGTSTALFAEQVTDAAQDKEIQSIAIHVDSGGGETDGAFDAALAVAEACKAKNVVAYIEDTGCSAAYLIASQADYIACNSNAWVSNVGTYAVIRDSSEAAKAAGLTVHVIKAGDLKGAGYPGTEVTDDHKTEFQSIVDDTNALFLKAVAKGRGMTMDRAREVAAEGHVYVGRKAEKAGLVDGVRSLDSVLSDMGKGVRLERHTSTAAQYGTTSTFHGGTMEENPGLIASIVAATLSAVGFGKNAAASTAAEPTTQAAQPQTTAAPPAPPAQPAVSAEMQALQARIAEQEKELATTRAQALDGHAEAFYMQAFEKNLVLPAEKDTVKAIFGLCASFDNAKGVKPDAQGSLVKALASMLEKKGPHAITGEQLPDNLKEGAFAYFPQTGTTSQADVATKAAETAKAWAAKNGGKA